MQPVEMQFGKMQLSQKKTFYINNKKKKKKKTLILIYHYLLVRTIQVTVEGGVRILGMAPNNRMKFLSWDIMRPHVMSIRLSLR